jgi:hypothetical protein
MMSAGVRQWIFHCADCVARCAIKRSVMGSVRAREMPEPNEYSVSGVRVYKGRGVLGAKGENRADLGVCCWLYTLPGDFGEGMDCIWIPRPGPTTCSNRERGVLFAIDISSSLVL